METDKRRAVCVPALSKAHEIDERRIRLFLSARLTGQDEIHAVCVLALGKAHETDERRVVCVVPFSKVYGT